MMQLDHMTRGRAMFGVGPRAFAHDAAKIGLKAEDQRSRTNQALDAIITLMGGGTATEKTDRYDLNGA